MNIFLLDYNMRKCVQYYTDKHVVKMILEYVQILCTVCFLRNVDAPYKPTHKKHPCVLWCNKSMDNWIALKKLTEYLNEEYKFRYKKTNDHLSWTKIMNINVPDDMPRIGLTKMALAMPEDCKTECTVESYRNYYIKYKKHIYSWKNRRIPEWIISL